MVTRVLALIGFAALVASAHAETVVSIELGIAKDGKPTAFWMEAIRNRVSPDAFSLIIDRKRPLDPQEKAWADLVRKTVPAFKETLANLNAPFALATHPEKVILVLGNQGGEDGFTCSLQHICLDLSRWTQAYGPPSEASGSERILRILSHEYTHLLTKAHLGITPYGPTNTFESALLDLYVEGLGHYYSLNSKWITPTGELTDFAKKRLSTAEIELTQRLVALRSANEHQYRDLTAGMNTGTFEDKWGAVPVALWLSRDTGRNPIKLRSWVDKGPAGIWELVQANLSSPLRTQLDTPKVSETKAVVKKDEPAWAAKFEARVFSALAGFILLALCTVWFWHGDISVIGFRERLRKPNLLTLAEHVQHHLLVPSLFSLAAVSIALFFVLSAASYLLGSVTGKWFDYDRSTFVTIQAGTMAILFPLVILILDSSDDSNSLVVSKREVLLRHALAFPISLTLLILSLYYLFNGSAVLATSATFACVALSLVALYRLLEITFSYEVAKRAEEKILAARAQRIAADDLAERISLSNTEKVIKKIGGPIEFEHFAGIMLEDRTDLDLIRVEAKKDGIISSINVRQLRKAAQVLAAWLKKTGTAAPGNDTPIRISVSAYPGKVLNEQEGRELALIVLPHGVGTAKFRSDLQQLLAKAIRVSTLRGRRSSALDTLMSKLGQSGRLAVRDDNLDLMISVRETFELLYESISDLLEKHRARLDGIEDPRKSRSIGKTYNPFESLIKQLTQLQREVVRKEDLDHEVRDTAVYIPYALATEALKRKDHKAYTTILGIADAQAGFSVYYKVGPRIRVSVVEWLSWILKYNLLRRKRKKLKSKLDDEIMELARLTVIQLQNAARYSSDANDLSSAFTAVKKIDDLLAPYNYDDTEHKIDMLKWQLERTTPGSPEHTKAAEELEREQASMHTEVTLRAWYRISLVALAGYALQCIDDANDRQPVTKENAEELLKYCVSHLPTSFQHVFELQLYAQDEGRTDNWGWGMWESHPDGQVFHPHTDTYIQRIFALLFYRAGNNISDKFTPSSYELDFRRAMPFRKNEQGFRLQVQRVPESKEGKAVGIRELKPEEYERLVSLFDEIEKEANLQDDLKITGQELSPRKIQEFKREFAEAFEEHAVFRRLVRWRPVNEKKFPALGFYEGTYRDSFVEKPNITTPGVGSHYGEGLAAGEDQEVFDKITKLIPETNKNISITTAVKRLIAAGVKAESIRIFASHKLFRSLIHKDNEFIPNHRLRDREFPDFVRGIYVVDGHEIPVVMVMVRNARLNQGIFVCALDQISLVISTSADADDMIQKFHIFLRVRDPIHDKELQENLLKRDKDKYQGIDPQLVPRLMGKMAYIEGHEGLDVEVNDPQLVFGVQIEASPAREDEEQSLPEDEE